MSVQARRNPKVARFIGLAHSAEEQLADALTLLADRHERESDVRDMCTLFAKWTRARMLGLREQIAEYGEFKSEHPQRLRSALYYGTRMGGVGLLQDLHDLFVQHMQPRFVYTMLEQAAKELHDKELERTAHEYGVEHERQLAWIRTKVKTASPEVLVVPSDHDSEIAASVPKRLSIVSTPDPIWAPLASATLTLVAVVLSLVLARPLLLPSLGPTAYLVAEQPAHPASRFYNIVVGHALGIAVAFVALFMLGASGEPSVLSGALPVGRLVASALAMALLLGTAPLLRATHPPAAASLLLVTLGAVATPTKALELMVGVVAVAVAGELLRRARLRHIPAAPQPRSAMET